MKIKAIIFDVDGVLIDSNKPIIKLYQKTARSLRLRVPSAQELIKLLGSSLEDVIKTTWPDCDVAHVAKVYRKFLMDNVFIPPLDGAIETVSKLKDFGFKFGVVSGKLRFFIVKHLKEAGFDVKLFDVIVSAEDTKKHKPNPEPILLACKKLNSKPEEALYIGDSRFDYEAAKNARVNYVAVLTGGLTKRELKEMNVKHILNSVRDLPKFLRL